MNNEIVALSLAAASLGFVHTILGPDHYLPFVAMARARNWSSLKTTIVTLLCGLGHVLSSVLLGIVGVAFGIAVFNLEIIESYRGDLAAWALTAFGMVYLVWGIRRAYRKRSHSHLAGHKGHGTSITPWVLFTIFVFGPCEPLIPLLMYPAARHSHVGMLAVAAIFSTVTTATMIGMVTLLNKGISVVPVGRLERFSHALAGFAILACGLAIHLGL